MRFDLKEALDAYLLFRDEAHEEVAAALLTVSIAIGSMGDEIAQLNECVRATATAVELRDGLDRLSGEIAKELRDGMSAIGDAIHAVAYGPVK